MTITIQQILEQAEATFENVNGFPFPEEPEETDINQLWSFCFATYQAACEDEDDAPEFSLQELEEAFEAPKGCPTGTEA